MMDCRDVRDSNQGNLVILPIMVKTVTLANVFQCGLVVQDLTGFIEYRVDLGSVNQIRAG